MALKHIHLEKVESTNRYLSGLKREQGMDEDILLSTDYQDAGKGRGSNYWHSHPGENILMSLLLHPAFLSASRQFALSQMASLSIVTLLSNHGLSPKIKWPNDILTGGKKIAGILIENGLFGSRLSHTIIGIGLNVNQTDFKSYSPEATSMKKEGLRGKEPRVLLAELVTLLQQGYRRLEEHGPAALEQDYLQYLYGKDEPGEFEVEGSLFSGIIRGISPLGELRVEGQGTTRTYGMDDIKCLVSSTW
jgi:BirA family biotin operon repressor/biotin-[acetyl-CoA-carboxylase] ligase